MAGHPTRTPVVTSEDLESVRGALMTLKRLPSDQKRLWDAIFEATFNRRVSMTGQELHSLRHSGEKYGGDTANDALRHMISAINVSLEPLRGYGYAVRVLRDNGDSYRLEIFRENTLPPDGEWFGHQLMWKAGKGITRCLNVWVPVHGEGREIQIKFRTTGDAWTPPSGFRGYAEFRKKRWEPYAEKHSKDLASQGWSVQRFLPFPARNGDQGIELTLAPVSFADIVATTLHLDKPTLDDPGADNGEKTIRDWLKRDQAKGNHFAHVGGLTHFLPAANPLSVEVNVITEDNYMVFRRYCPRHDDPTRENQGSRWEPAIFGYVDPLLDVYRNNLNLPDHNETAFRKACELLNFPILATNIKWLGVGFGLKYGRVSLLGEVQIPLTVKNLSDLPKYGTLKMVKAIAPDINAFLQEGDPNSKPHRDHFEALLALSLARNDKRHQVKVFTSTRPSEGLLALLGKKAAACKIKTQL